MVAEIQGTLVSPRPATCETSRVVIANRNEIARAGIEALLQASGHIIVACCSHEQDLFHSVATYHPHIIIMADNIAPHGKAAKTVLRLRAGNCSAMIILLVGEGHAIAAADVPYLDVDGILLSVACARSVIDCVESVRHGRKWVDPSLMRHLVTAKRSAQAASGLTSRETEIAHLVSQGFRNKEIARQLSLSDGTVKMRLHHIYEKLHLGGRMQLAHACTQMAVLDYEVRPADSADLLKGKDTTIIAVDCSVDHDSIRLIGKRAGITQGSSCSNEGSR
jgi:two-component system nitrate/nitrite response regulator NarL